ncbi:YbaB/EbfC family nucleoid-associated protein [Actinophytocola gossypii]|uniref:YbaB/EbfC family nucleoid-associated protein n=1 Tax=Actinophytocola gossypii TaxID=2812003 RepID=A0ABT2J3C6_9PSEU|nr:YbaB/EbfC family nucleoid-associated protein [Actinophytocola gossypii]MCT2582359.1 YbaB/EbfC family nucleoid-associated protein [Actinophytocola gossypii]
MTGDSAIDYATDSAIAELTRLADGADREARDLTDRLDRVTAELAAKRFTASAGGVTATVTGAGALVAVTIAPVDRRRPRTEQLSADLTSAVLAARATASAEVAARMREVVPGRRGRVQAEEGRMTQGRDPALPRTGHNYVL